MGWLLALAGIGVIIAGAMATDAAPGSRQILQFAIPAGIVLVLAGAIGGILGSQVLVPRRIDRDFVWLSKVSPEYLAELPDWDVPRNRPL